MRVSVAAISVLVLLCGCDGGGGESSGGAGGGTGASSSSGGATSTGGTSSGGATSTGGGVGAGDGEVPAEKTALFAYLQAGKYKGFAAESGAHPSSGPHSGDVRVFLNPALDASLAANDSVYPKGAAAVKELNVSGGVPGGWAVFVKTAGDSAGGDGFYWYEILNTIDGSNPPYEGNGEAICTGCHSGGTDFYLSAYPLK